MSRILFADHNGFTQRMGIQFLTAEGHDVASASGGTDALRYIQEQRPDIAILDTQMAEPSGLELCWRIKSDSNLRDTKVVLLNRVVDPIPESEAKKAGSDAMLLKPLDGTLLVGTVNSLVERMRSEISMAEGLSQPIPMNGWHSVNLEPSENEGSPSPVEIEDEGTSNGTSGLAALEAAVAVAVEAAPAEAPKDEAITRESEITLAMSPVRNGNYSNAAGRVAGLGRPVVYKRNREEMETMNATEVLVEQEHDRSSAVDFAAIVDEALGNDTEERELQAQIEKAIYRILQPAITAVAENVTKEVYVAYRAQRRVEEAVNGLLLPALVSIADGSNQGVMAAFRSK